MAVVTRFTLNKAGVNQVLKGRQGPVVLHQANLGRQVAATARRIAPRGHGDGPHIADHISSRLIPAAGGGYRVVIVAAVAHAIYVIKRTKPHSIGSSVLVAPNTWRYIGRSPKGKTSPGGRGKIHPGTKGNNFLTRAAAAHGLRMRQLI